MAIFQLRASLIDLRWKICASVRRNQIKLKQESESERKEEKLRRTQKEAWAAPLSVRALLADKSSGAEVKWPACSWFSPCDARTN